MDQDTLDKYAMFIGALFLLVVFGLVIALIYSLFNPPQCPEGMIYVSKLNICMEGVKPL